MKNISKSFILSLIIILFYNKAFSQNTFKKIYNLGGSTPTSIIFLNSNYYLGYFDFNSLFCKLDINGNLLDLHYLNSIPGLAGGGSTTNSYFLTDSNNLIFFSSGLDSSYRLCLTSYNIQNNSFNWITGFNISNIPNNLNFPRFACLNKGILKSYLLSCYKYFQISFPKRTPLVITSDSTGNLENSYHFNNYFGTPSFTHQFSDYSYITGINYTDSLGATLIRYDTTGSVIWAKTFFTSKSCFHSSVNNNDGTLTLIGSPDSTNTSNQRIQIFLMKIDTSGNVLWCKQYGDSIRSFGRYPSCQLKATNDGGYIILGSTSNSLPSIYNSDLILIKTDANGDTLWTRTHGSTSTAESGDDIEQTPDGGYILTGYSSSHQFMYGGELVFKVDSLGMTSSHCQEFNTPIAVNNIIPNDSNIVVPITTGLITAIPSSVFDTSFAIYSADGCLLSTIEEPSNQPSSNLHVVPNPTSGHFKIKTSLNTQKLTVYIYDIIGNLLFEKQYINQPEIELDLNNRGKGVYTVRVFDGEVVTFSKVVVE